jgi:hypothetical protein
MSTRATYSFGSKCVYIHHDGYLSGGAMYFNNAIKYQKEHGGSIYDCFMAANKGAEKTVSHEHHGDTEFQYRVTEGETFEDSTVTVHNIRFVEYFHPNGKSSYHRQKNGVFIGSIRSLIEKHPEHCK